MTNGVSNRDALTDRVHCWVQGNRDAIIERLCAFVRIDTQSYPPNGKELEGQLLVASMLRELGCEVDVYELSSVPGFTEHPRFWAERPCTGRPNVMGVRKGSGGGRSMMFSSHMDTALVGTETWEKQPFGGEVADGKVWGLGSCDMKAGHAASLAVVQALRDLGINLKGNLLVESVVDEELGGCNGTLAARLKYNADFAIIPEPTNLQLAPAHHGGWLLRATFRGRPGIAFNASKPIDPTAAVARFIDFLNRWKIERQDRIEPPPQFANNRFLPVAINQVRAGDTLRDFCADRVPAKAEIAFWIAAYPGMTSEEVLEDLRTGYQQAKATDDVLKDFEPEYQLLRWLDGSQIAPDHPGIDTFATAFHNVRNEQANVSGIAMACDGHIFNLASPTPAVVFGPVGGNAHAPNEFVVIDDLLSLIEIYIRGTIEWCGLA